MIYDGCELDRYLRDGHSTSEKGGVMTVGHWITSPSLCVYGSLAVNK